MTLKTIAARVPEDIDENLKQIMVEEGMDKSATTRKILELGIHAWRKQKAIELLRERKVTVEKAAEVAGMSVYQFIDILQSERIDYIYISLDELESDLALAKRD